jgi:hypothetical protein
MRRGILGSVLCLAATTIVAQTWQEWAKTFPAPEFPTSPKEKGVVTEEVQYIFTVQEYTPAVAVEPVAREQASYENPERAAISVLSAMASGDWEWWLSTWSKKARGKIEARPDVERRRVFWAEDQKKAFAQRVAKLTHRIETGPYVVIAFRLDPADPTGQPRQKKVRPELIVTKKYEDGWLVTDELTGDLVLAYWPRGGAVHRRIER